MNVPVLIREGRKEWFIGLKKYKEKPLFSPISYYRDELTGLKFRLKFRRQSKKDSRICTKCDTYFKVSESSHREQCSDECYKKHKTRNRKERLDRNRHKKYESLPADEIPDGFCKVCGKNISDRRTGALICENPTHRKQYNRRKIIDGKKRWDKKIIIFPLFSGD
jgi:hypothetical protein